MIELKNISKTYTEGENVTALSNLSLTIGTGEFVAILGPSGCGKSTLMHIIGLLDRPENGEYELDGKRVDRLSRRELARLRNQLFGFVFQSFNLLTRTTAYDNVALPLQYGGGDKSKIEQTLKDVGIWDRRKHYSNQMSGGQQQRVAIARALVSNPKIVLADEPTGNLDSKTGLEIMELFKKIHAEGKTIIFVTHNDELLRYATRVIRMKDGQITEDNHVGQ